MNIFTGIHVDILYAKAGEVNNVVINRIVGAKVRYVLCNCFRSFDLVCHCVHCAASYYYWGGTEPSRLETL